MPKQNGRGTDLKDKWMKVELTAPSELIDALSNFMTEIGAQGVFQEASYLESSNGFAENADSETLKAYLPFDIRLESRLKSLQIYIESLSQVFPDLRKPVFETERIDDPDWGEAWKKYFKPLRATKNIVIKPTWERFTPVGHDIVIDIDPGMAFGTGQHASTRLCLQAIEYLLLQERTMAKWRVLDVGTGTGILGISCAKLGVQKVVCVDSDKKAADIARENVAINGVEDRVEVINRDVATIHERFDLIVANLTAKILTKHRSHLVSLLGPDSYMIISGVIEQDREEIESHFITAPLTSQHVITEKEWLCYVLRKGGSAY
ncbi:MAG: 50S ribosomal protein L11 methyltransferase [Deltaproteobacteria bacterium HGW-Deltaproteobacteria-11]|nr:MAG: 50S ribosomal protein L11 methyltransferase [Deltaproteobacteria bacterium HGW-Deltaproteobacteria-11]